MFQMYSLTFTYQMHYEISHQKSFTLRMVVNAECPEVDRARVCVWSRLAWSPSLPGLFLFSNKVGVTEQRSALKWRRTSLFLFTVTRFLF